MPKVLNQDTCLNTLFLSERYIFRSVLSGCYPNRTMTVSFCRCQVLSTDQYSFLCGNETIFDQATLTCNYPVDSVPCEDAEAMFSLRNDEFFRKLDGSEA